MKKWSFVVIVSILLSACGGETLPKPKSYLKLHYPIATYKRIQSNCPYTFEVSTLAKVEIKNNCWAKIEYPKLKATIHITYRSVDNNLNDILKEVEKLTFEHTIKADVISDRPYNDEEKKVYAKLYNIEGNVATNIQFRATDSLKHVLSGALYFYTKPNYDSIVPAIKYIEKDMMKLVESLEWK